MMVTARRSRPPIAYLAELEAIAAQRDAALEAVRSLVRHVRKVGGYMPTEDQKALWRAEGLLVESARW